MPTHLLNHLPQVNARIAKALHLLVMLDFDGTLTHLVDHPPDAHLDTDARRAVAAIAQRSNTSVAILSGRALADIQVRVGIEGLTYGGNHGLEICGPGFYSIRSNSKELQRELPRLAEELAEQLGHIPGALVENKRLSLSIHYRLVPPVLVKEVRDIVGKHMARLEPAFGLTCGHKVFEIRPNVYWNKGTACLWIQNQLEFQLGRRDILPIFLGDDRTDEDAFQVLSHGITIKIGDTTETLADYHLPGPPDVCRFLEWLLRIDRQDPPCAAAG